MKLWYNWIMLRQEEESDGIRGWALVGRKQGQPAAKIAVLERASDTTWTVRVEFPPKSHQGLTLREATETIAAAARARLHEAFALHPLSLEGKRG